VEKVCVVGLGYIGLPTALLAAQHGFEVFGYDIDVQRVEKINRYDPVICEPEIRNMLTQVLQAGHFRAHTAIVPADCYVIAVPTPFTKDKSADLSYVFQAGESIASVLKRGDVVILESTVPVGATKRLADFLSERSGLVGGRDFFCAHCPERVLPGKIFYELVHNARVIGGITVESACAAKQFYVRFVRGQMFLTTAETAEMVKLIENSARDVQIAFAHEIAAMAAQADIDPYEVIELANKHPRVSILQPRCGVGGHCIAVDPWFLIEGFPLQTRLLQLSRSINDERPLEIVNRIMSAITTQSVHHHRPCHLLLLGATYKPDVDDVRESPAIIIAKKCMEQEQVMVRLCDPYVTSEQVQAKGLPQTIALGDGLHWADIVVCLVAHSVFKHQIESIAQHANVLDFCGLLYQERYASAVSFKAAAVDTTVVPASNKRLEISESSSRE
jgi:UDP-N-acetyl-D-mannosaminuronic acid dehydrogenase